MTEFPIKREENETQSMLDSLYIKVRNQANIICGDREQLLSFLGDGERGPKGTSGMLDMFYKLDGH